MNLWNFPGVPHKGWRNVDVIDLGGGNYERCQMCGNENVRFRHVMEHADCRPFEVGSSCAEKMAEGYCAKRRQAEVASRTRRRSNWLFRSGWTVSSNGNRMITVNGRRCVIFPDWWQPGWFRYSVNRVVSEGSYPSADEARLALFDRLWPA